MLNNNVVELLQKQINKEFFSAYLYLDISAYFADANLDGFANWYKIQAQEERDHAMLFMEYLQNNDIRPVLGEIGAPKLNVNEFIDALEESLRHEKYITASINDIYGEAVKVKDYRSMQFLDWFIAEQGEEEKNATDLIGKFKVFATDGNGLYTLNEELKGRVYSAPSLVL